MTIVGYVFLCICAVTLIVTIASMFVGPMKMKLVSAVSICGFFVIALIVMALRGKAP